MDIQFGNNVHKNALALAASGKDPNQIAKVLCDQDPDGHNYGIGIMLDGQGKPMSTSSSLLEYTQNEIANSGQGNYINSAKIINELTEATLKWQRIPEKYWDQFILALPSDAGTGAVKTAIEFELLLNSKIDKIGIEQYGWPAYKTIAKTSRIGCEEFQQDGVIEDPRILPVYQAGPMNTTGKVRSKELIQARAKSASDHNMHVVLDRAYPGFEFARLQSTQSYHDIMYKSFELQIEPFIEQGVPFSLSLSPTKAFVTFALRPCGLLLVFCPKNSQKNELTTLLSTTIRARGSSFENPITRAFARLMVNEPHRLEEEHQQAIKRLDEAESLWRKLVKGTAIEYLYSDQYSGLFRNPEAKEGSAEFIYNEHIYPVFSQGRCRQNVTGIPDNEELAKAHVDIFAAYCQ